VTHSTSDLDDVVHQRVRLGILTVLHEGGSVEFGYLLDVLGVTAGNLSRHLHLLGKMGFIHTEKKHHRGRQRTWISSTRTGTEALRAEIRILKSLVARVELADPAVPLGSSATEATATPTGLRS
jgi:DNA-binding MarR family transcriptional regulator